MIQKKIMITGSTDGIGLATARMMVKGGHHVLIHGRDPVKLRKAERELTDLTADAKVECYKADLSLMSEVEALAEAVASRHSSLDALINNAGVFNMPVSARITSENLDARFAVNTIAPYLLTRRLLSLLGRNARVVNLSSAAQAGLNPESLSTPSVLDDGNVYAQSKLALTAWSRSMALSLKEDEPVIVTVNPGSLLGSKMVKEAYGIAGGDINIGADILSRAALSEEFADANGMYFDNDRGIFASPHPDALVSGFGEAIVDTLERILA